MNKDYFLVYWFNYKHQSTIYPIYLEMKKRGLNVEGILYRPELTTDEIRNKFKNASAIITSSNCPLPYYELNLTDKIVWTWHGAGNCLTNEGKDLNNCKYVAKHKLNLMMGSIDYNKFKRKMNNLEMVGYPKFDNIPDINLNLSYDKTVFFVEQAYWHNDGGLKQQYSTIVKKLVQLSKKLKFNILIRRFSLADTRFDKYASASVRILEKEDSTTIYHKKADLFIGDIFGSNLYEAIGLDTPVLYYRIVRRGYFVDDTMNNITFGLGLNIHNLEDSILRTFSKPKEFEEQRISFKNKMFCNVDNKASERAVDAILKRI